MHLLVQRLGTPRGAVGRHEKGALTGIASKAVMVPTRLLTGIAFTGEIGLTSPCPCKQAWCFARFFRL